MAQLRRRFVTRALLGVALATGALGIDAANGFGRLDGLRYLIVSGRGMRQAFEARLVIREVFGGR